jgi:hypothetical protein
MSAKLYELTMKSLKSKGLLQNTLHVFDLDDTLLLTKDIVKQAYVNAGAKPSDFDVHYGEPAALWSNPDLAGIKALEYEKLLRDKSHVKLFTPLSQVANDVEIRGRSNVLTSASFASYQLLQRYVGHLPPLMGAGCTLQSKIGKIRNAQKNFVGPVVYYDDSLKVIEQMTLALKQDIDFKGYMCHYDGDGLTFHTVSSESEQVWTV